MSEVSIGGFVYCFIVSILFIPLIVSSSLIEHRNAVAYGPTDSKDKLSVRSNEMTSREASVFRGHFEAYATPSFTSDRDLTFKERNRHYYDNEPSFDTQMARNVTAAAGSEKTFLECRIFNLGDRTVSWVRQRDLHILTSGEYVYTSDQRFRSIHHENGWTLEIRDAQINDTGIYECQISTETKLSASVLLNIIDVKAVISEESDIHLQKGSSINLSCTINFVRHGDGPSVLWYHNNALINYDSNERGVKVNTQTKEGTTISRLIISDARSSDSGNYSCKMSQFANSGVVTVHVLNGGENPAAMQHGKNGESSVAGTANSASIAYTPLTISTCIVHLLSVALFVRSEIALKLLSSSER